MIPDTLIEVLASSVATLLLYALARLGQLARVPTSHQSTAL